MKPVLYGYQVIEAGTAPEAVRAGQTTFRHYAIREGFALGPVFVQRRTDAPGAALEAVIRAAKRFPMAVVAVPTRDDLGRSPGSRWLTRYLLLREAGVRVLVAERRS